MKNYHLNELTPNNNDNSGNNVGVGHHSAIRSSSSSLAPSLTSINHQTVSSAASLDRICLTNNVAMAHSTSTPLPTESAHLQQHRANQLYQTENNLISLHNDNIDWRDEADGSEEEECRLNLAMSGSASDPHPPINLQSNLLGQNSSNASLHNHSPSLFTNMVEADLRCQTTTAATTSINHNFVDSSRLSGSKNLENGAREKQLRDTELHINRMEDLLVSFKNLLKSNGSNATNGQDIGINHVNLNSNNNYVNAVSNRHKFIPMTVPKNINTSLHPGNSRVLNRFSPSTIPKNAHLLTEPVDNDISRNKTDCKIFGNRFQQSPPSDIVNNNSGVFATPENDFNIADIGLTIDSCFPMTENGIDNFYRLINMQINALRKRLEQLALVVDPKENISPGFGDSSWQQCQLPPQLPQQPLQQTSFNEQSLRDTVENCCLQSALPDSPLNNPDDSATNAYFRVLNQQIYQLLLQQNYQINQQHQLIQSWINSQQKWLEKQVSLSHYKFAPNSLWNINRDTNGNEANNVYHFNEAAPAPSTSNFSTSIASNNNKHSNCIFTPDIMLNNRTEPRSRANNFWDNFRSQSQQNKLQSNHDIARELNQISNHANGNNNNCSNSCINIGTCNKNSRSQSFASFIGGNIATNRKAPNQSNIFSNHLHYPDHHHQNSLNESPPNLMPYFGQKKLNTCNVAGMNNAQQLTKLLSMVGKLADIDSVTNKNVVTKVSQSKVYSAAPTTTTTNTTSRTSFLSNNPTINGHNKNGSCKRKKFNNMNNGDTNLTYGPMLPDNLCEFEANQEDDHDSIDLEEPSFIEHAPSMPRTNSNEQNVHNNGGSSASNGSSAAFHVEKCNFQVPLTISPHTGAIRKKPIFDCNFKCAATDNQKLSMQHHSQSDVTDSSSANLFIGASSNSNGLNENIRPLMPAEGRSSEQMPLPNSGNPPPIPNISTKAKISNSSQKYSITRPPITGAGNESSITSVFKRANYVGSNSHSKQDSLTSGFDDRNKANMTATLNNDCEKNDRSADDIDDEQTDLHCNRNEFNHDDDVDIDDDDHFDNDDEQIKNDKSDTISSAISNRLNEDQRLLDGSSGPSLPSISNIKGTSSNLCTGVGVSIHTNGISNNSHQSLGCGTTSNNKDAEKKDISLNGGCGPAADISGNGNNNGDVNKVTAVNGHFISDDMIRVNGHNIARSNEHEHDEDDENADLDEDKDTDVRLLSLAAGNEVRTAVRLSGDGEQGL